MSLGEQIRDDIWSLHANFHEFWKHRGGDMNLSSFSFYEFCILEEQELWRIAYMKDVVLYEVVPTKFDSYFSDLYFIFYEFSNFTNGQVYKNTTVTRLPSSWGELISWALKDKVKMGGGSPVGEAGGDCQGGHGCGSHMRQSSGNG
jgi:hypothetical protein